MTLHYICPVHGDANAETFSDREDDGMIHHRHNVDGCNREVWVLEHMTGSDKIDVAYELIGKGDKQNESAKAIIATFKRGDVITS